MKHIGTKLRLIFLTIFLCFTLIVLYLFRNSTHNPADLLVPDQNAIRSVIKSSDTIRIFDIVSDTTLYETTNAEEICWVSDAFVVSNSWEYSRQMSISRYRLLFYRDSTIIAHIQLIRGLCFYWLQGSWDWTSDFWLTEESNQEIIPWLCEKTGKNMHDLFDGCGKVSEQETPEKPE